MQLTLAQVVDATGAQLFVNGMPERDLRSVCGVSVDGWSIDSRTLAKGDVFVALKGERLDGHAFIQAALNRGAAAALASEVPMAKPAGAVLKVRDTVESLGMLARRAREKWGRPVVAVTGSAGKTSTKDIIATLLGVRFRVGKTIGNLNNHIGLPLTLLRLQDDADLAVVEMGMNHAGEIRRMAVVAQPQVAVITNIGYAHIEAFKSIDDIAAAKRELIESLPSDGVAVLNADDERVLAFRAAHSGKVVTYGCAAEADIRAERVETEATGSEFTVEGVRFETTLAGRHAVSNILAGLAVARVFGIALRDLTGVVAGLTADRMRGERRHARGVTILDDTYNSNPEAARSMIDVLLEQPAMRRIAVLGEMLELGEWAETLHRETGRYAAKRGVDVLVGVRGASRFMVEEARVAGMSEQAGMGTRPAFFFEDPEDAGKFLSGFIRPGDAILFKGSRGTHVERAIARMEE